MTIDGFSQTSKAGLRASYEVSRKIAVAKKSQHRRTVNITLLRKYHINALGSSERCLDASLKYFANWHTWK